MWAVAGLPSAHVRVTIRVGTATSKKGKAMPAGAVGAARLHQLRRSPDAVWSSRLRRAVVAARHGILSWRVPGSMIKTTSERVSDLGLQLASEWLACLVAGLSKGGRAGSRSRIWCSRSWGSA